MNKHLQYMFRAYQLALKGRGKTLPNPMVGALLLKGQTVIAEGWHKRCGAGHAEAMAIKSAGAKAKGATLYVTLEPCAHWGRTPPCTEAVIQAGIKKVVVGVLDPNPQMNGKSVVSLRKAGISVEVGFLKEELTRMNEAFNTYITKRRPFVAAKIAQTLDGKVATLSGESKWITSKVTREFGRKLRGHFNGIMVGIKTVLADDPCLIVSGRGKCLKKIIIDSKLRIPLKARLFKGASPDDVIVVTTGQAPRAKVRAVQKKACVWMAPSKKGRVDLVWAFKKLAKAEIAAILIEGGPTLIGSALNAGLVDKMHIYIAPKVMGEGLASVRGFRPKRLADIFNLKDVSVGKIGDDVFVEGYVHRDH